MRVLLIGFGPFPGASFNPSAVLVKALARRRRPALANAVLSTHIFATIYAAVDRGLPMLFAQRPDIVLMFGFAGRRRHLCIESRARNAASVLFPDAGGYRPQRSVVAPGAAAAHKGGAPFADLLGAARSSGFPARLSHDAGRYLCNYAYWRALERAASGQPLIAFIHIPATRIDSRPRRGPSARRSPSFRLLITAAERLLVALIAASRR